MTAKQKANNLIGSYYVLLDGFVTFEQVKICALIAVDEILEITEHESPSTYVYYKEVKKEIENL